MIAVHRRRRSLLGRNNAALLQNQAGDSNWNKSVPPKIVEVEEEDDDVASEGVAAGQGKLVIVPRPETEEGFLPQLDSSSSSSSWSSTSSFLDDSFSIATLDDDSSLIVASTTRKRQVSFCLPGTGVPKNSYRAQTEPSLCRSLHVGDIPLADPSCSLLEGFQIGVVGGNSTTCCGPIWLVGTMAIEPLKEDDEEETDEEEDTMDPCDDEVQQCGYDEDSNPKISVVVAKSLMNGPIMTDYDPVMLQVDEALRGSEKEKVSKENRSVTEKECDVDVVPARAPFLVNPLTAVDGASLASESSSNHQVLKKYEGSEGDLGVLQAEVLFLIVVQLGLLKMSFVL